MGVISEVNRVCRVVVSASNPLCRVVASASNPLGQVPMPLVPLGQVPDKSTVDLECLSPAGGESMGMQGQDMFTKQCSSTFAGLLPVYLLRNSVVTVVQLSRHGNQV